MGPEISFAFSGPIRFRLDGSAWLTVAEPVALNGHRFRLEHGSEQVLVTAAATRRLLSPPGRRGGDRLGQLAALSLRRSQDDIPLLPNSGSSTG